MLPTQEQQKIQVAKAHVKCNREQSAQKKKMYVQVKTTN